MSKFKMEFYNTESGVMFDVNWADESEYLSAKVFLQDLLGGPVPNVGEPDKPPFYMIETLQQRDAFFAFQGELRKKR